MISYLVVDLELFQKEIKTVIEGQINANQERIIREERLEKQLQQYFGTRVIRL